MRLGFDAQATPTERRLVVATLAAAVLAISASAVLVRLAPDVHPMTLALYRTLGGALLLAPGLRRVAPKDLAWIALAGMCLAAHFATWFASLQLTTVLRSTLLVTLAPIWAALVEWLVLGHRPPRRFFLGLLVAVPGAALLATGGGSPSWEGDLLALVGGQLSAVYFVAGRKVRARVGIATYGALVCLAAAACLVPAVAVTPSASLFGFDGRTALVIGGIVLGPQLIGHNGLNFALRYLPAAIVGAFTLLEPVGAAALAVVLLGEIPPPAAAAGALVVVAGVLAATTTRQSPS